MEVTTLQGLVDAVFVMKDEWWSKGTKSIFLF